MRLLTCNRIARSFAVILLLAIATATTPGPDRSLTAAPGLEGEAGSVSQAQDWPIVVDRAEMLDDGQESSAVHDAWRLNLYGIPTQVVTEAVALTQTQADARAREIRIADGIASKPGADDGLLIYAAMDPNDRSLVVMSISTGQNTLPHNGFDAASLDEIRGGIVSDQLAQGHPARAIVYSMREMIYLEQYVPPPVPTLTGWRARAHAVVSILAPVAAAVGAAWLIRRRTSTGTRESVQPAVLIAVAAIAMLMLVAAVISRSALGILSGGGLLAIVTWLAVSTSSPVEIGSARRLGATPRPPGSRTPARMRRATSR